ncbi:PE domain-containing protein [Mycobacterium canetti]|uniref:PE domain-containing protein n=1 Tax=Mycobacterium canetti TaxID=78331 RepID=UPI00030F3042|nr:PE domain-containing protein [Mycobacterium canetti]
MKVLAPAADVVSAGIAAPCSAQAQTYQAVSAQAAASLIGNGTPGASGGYGGGNDGAGNLGGAANPGRKRRPCVLPCAVPGASGLDG